MILRVSKNHELTLRKKESSLSKELWIGVAMASALHILLFFLFRIVSPANIADIPILVPVAVEVDLGAPIVNVSSPPTSQTAQTPIEDIEAPPLLDIPVPHFKPSYIAESYHKEIPFSPDFSEIEKFEDEFLSEFEEEIEE